MVGSDNSWIHVTAETVPVVRQRIDKCLRLLEIYDWMINSFVLDFFLEDHWTRLPHSWQQPLASFTPQQLASLLDPSSPPSQGSEPWPLSLLAFKQAIHYLSLDRNQVSDFGFVKPYISQTINSTLNNSTTNSDNNNSHSNTNCSDNENISQSNLINSNCSAKSRSNNGCIGKAKRCKLDSSSPAAPDPEAPASSASVAGVHVPQGARNAGKSNWSLGSLENKRWEFYPEHGEQLPIQHPALRHIFRKHVKPKKQYELSRMAKLSSDILHQIGVENVIDVGSGVGHLSRYLCYGHNIQAACVDSNNDFTDSAKRFDLQLEESVRKLSSRGEEGLQLPHPPVHVNAFLEPNMDLQKFHGILSQKFQQESSQAEELKYGILGLHTCGDLGPVLIKMFHLDDKAKLLLSVGCCYMKVQEHFPLSTHLQHHSTTWRLTYTNSELACHAVEMFTERLRQGEEDKLKVHCYRAALERVLVTRDPALRHTILRTVARAHTLPFPQYAIQATSKLEQKFTAEDFISAQIDQNLGRWWEVVTFYTLRLSLAPVIETVLLLDRCLYLQEQGCPSIIFPLFNPSLSPRNQIILSASK